MAAMINPEKKVRDAGTRVEMRIETLSVDGRVSACAEQVGPIEKAPSRNAKSPPRMGQHANNTYLWPRGNKTPSAKYAR